MNLCTKINLSERMSADTKFTGRPEGPDSTTNEPISRWWIGVAVPVVFDMIFLATELATSYSMNSSGDGVDVVTSTGLVALVLLIPSLLILPVAVYVDSRRIRESNVEWKPRPVIWALISFLAIVGLPLTFTSSPIDFRTATLLVCGIYLFRRFAAIGTR